MNNHPTGTITFLFTGIEYFKENVING